MFGNAKQFGFQVLALFHKYVGSFEAGLSAYQKLENSPLNSNSCFKRETGY